MRDSIHLSHVLLEIPLITWKIVWRSHG